MSEQKEPERLDADQLIGDDDLRVSYTQKKDSWITKTALAVVAGSALVSAAALIIYPIWLRECDSSSVCGPAAPPQWAAEMLRLTLVSSLAFVMGSQSGNGS